MSVQVDRHKTGNFGALKLRNPQLKLAGDYPTDTTNPEPKSAVLASAHDKAIRSKEWRIACRRFSFIFEPFKRRAKSADPRNLSTTENGSKTDLITPVSSTSFPQPPLIATHIQNDRSSKIRMPHVAPVNITGVVFERYRRAREAAGSLALMTLPNGCLQEERAVPSSWLSNPRPNSKWVPSNRPASFHPILPQSENIVTSYPHQQKQLHHNPYLYQHIRSFSDNQTGDNSLSEQEKEVNGSLPYQSFRVRSATITDNSPATAETNSLDYDSLYDFPPSLTIYPCPTVQLDSTSSHSETVHRVPPSVGRKRPPRPSSIDPLLTRLASLSRKPINLTGATQPKSCRCSALSRPCSELVEQKYTPPVDSTKPMPQLERLVLAPSTVPSGQSVSKSQAELGMVRGNGIVPSHSLGSNYSSNCRHQLLDGSAAVCKVTVCHSAPKLCATVAEPLTQRPNIPSMRPRSILLDRNPPTDSDGPKHTAHPKPELYHLSSARNPVSRRSTAILQQTKSPPLVEGSADLDLTVCSNAASASIRQRRGRDPDRLNSNLIDARSVQAHSKVSVHELTGLSNSKPTSIDQRMNDIVVHRPCCACDTPVHNTQSDAMSRIPPVAVTEDSSLTPQLVDRHSLPNKDGKHDVLTNGSMVHSFAHRHNGIKHRLSASNRNSWSAQTKVNRSICGDQFPTPISTDETMPTNTEPNHRHRTTASRPNSVILVPSPVCLPPPVGTRVFTQQRTPFSMATMPINNACFVDRLRPEGHNHLATGGTRRYRAPNVSTLRPPRPPTRTTSLVRGGGRDSRESSCTPPSDSKPPTALSDKSSSQDPVPEAACTSPSFQDFPTSASTLSSSTRMTLSDTSVDPRDKMADSEVEQSVNDRDPMWWLSLLPYKPSNLPTNLADRLRQRNSLCLSRCSPNSHMSNSSLPTTLPLMYHPQPHSQSSLIHSVTGRETMARPAGATLTPHLMTQSLYEQRDSTNTVYSNHLSPDPTPTASRNDLLPSRPALARLPTRPSSLYIDKPDPHPILMPSLAHLSSSGVSTNPRRTSGAIGDQSDESSTPDSSSSSVRSQQASTEPEVIEDPFSILSSYSNNIALSDSLFLKSLNTNKTDSPLLGQYCRLLNLRTTTAPHTNGSVVNTGDLPTPSTETPLTPV